VQPRTKEDFVDYYNILQVSPTAMPVTIRRVYRTLVAHFHPDNPDTGDLNTFLSLNEGYRVLINPVLRAEYDAERVSRRIGVLGVAGAEDAAVDIKGEGDRRMSILCLLSNRRRRSPDRPGISVLEFEKSMGLEQEDLLFTLWYLKEKHLVDQDHSSDYTITAEGVDYVEEQLPSHDVLHRLLKAGDSLRATAAS